MPIAIAPSDLRSFKGNALSYNNTQNPPHDTDSTGLMESQWATRIATFIETRTKELEPLFNAAGCREEWVQAELFLHFHPNHPEFWVNHIPIGPKLKADLCNDVFFDQGRVVVNGPAPMVGEVKMISADHQYKCITGGAIETFRSLPKEKNGRICRDDLKHIQQGSWGLIPDYNRLIELSAPDEVQRVLVLVAKTNTDRSRIGADLVQIDFVGSVCIKKPLGSWGFVRIWTLVP